MEDLTIYNKRLADALYYLQEAASLIRDVRDDMMNDIADDDEDGSNDTLDEVVNTLDNIAEYDLEDKVYELEQIIEYVNGRESNYDY